MTARLTAAAGGAASSDMIVEEINRVRKGFLIFEEGEYVIERDLTVPRDISLRFEPGAVLTAKKGVTVIIESDFIDAGNYQIFGGDGSITGFVNQEYATPVWWGLKSNVDTDAAPYIQKALDACNIVRIQQGNYQIKSAVTVPPGRAMKLSGDGYRTTVFHVSDRVTALYFQYKDGMPDGTYLTVNDIAFVGTGNENEAGAVYFHGIYKHAGNWLNMDSCYFHRLGTCVDIGEAGQCHFTANFALQCGTAYHLTRNAAFIYFDRCMNLANVHFIWAEDEKADGISDGIFISETHSVGHLGTDVYINGWQAVWIEQGGYDLGRGGEDSYAIHFKDCQDIRISDTWIASDNISSPKRKGVLFEKSQKCSIVNSSIVNHNIGVMVKGGVYRGNTVISGCQFENNNHYDVYLENTSDVRVMQNNFLSTGSKESFRTSSYLI